MLHSYQEVQSYKSAHNTPSVLNGGSRMSTYSRILWSTLLVGVVMRMLVLVSESYAMISSSRLSNEELLDLCKEGIASNSPHMRSACLQARIEQASPAILRAINSALYAFVTDLYNLALQPLQALGVAGLVSLLSALPWIGTLKTFIPTLVANIFKSKKLKVEDIEENLDQRVIVLRNGTSFSPDCLRQCPQKRQLYACPFEED